MRIIALSNAEQGQEIEAVVFREDGTLVHDEDLDAAPTESFYISWWFVAGLLLAGAFIGWLFCMLVTL